MSGSYNTHSIYSASGAHRWMACPPSALLEQQFPSETSSFAEEGTAAHDLAEHKLKKALKMRSRKPNSKYQTDEMDEMTDLYVEYCLEVIEKAKESCKDLQILIEQKLDFSDYVPEGFGTGDLVIVGTGTLHVIDLKYGRGVIVSAERNPQMMLYALGALSLFEMLYDIDKVSMTIIQPRVDNFSTYELRVEELLQVLAVFLPLLQVVYPLDFPLSLQVGLSLVLSLMMKLLHCLMRLFHFPLMPLPSIQYFQPGFLSPLQHQEHV